MARGKKGRRTDATGRSKTPFIRLHRGITNSAAWHALSAHASKLLIGIWERHNGTNNGAIGYGVDEARAYLRCGSDRARQAFKELQDLGFIVCRSDYCHHQKNGRAREWELTMEPANGRGPLSAYRDWQPDHKHKQNTVPASGTQRTRVGYDEAFERNNVSTILPALGTETPLQTLSSVPASGNHIDIPSGGNSAGTATTPPPPSSEPSPEEEGRAGARSVTSSVTDVEGPKEGPHGDLAPRLQRKEDSNPKKQPRNPARPADVIDLEEWLDARPQISPQEQLRLDLDAHLERSPRGELSRVAERAGISRPHLSNFRSGTFQLSKVAAAQLRKILDEDKAA